MYRDERIPQYLLDPTQGLSKESALRVGVLYISIMEAFGIGVTDLEGEFITVIRYIRAIITDD